MQLKNFLFRLTEFARYFWLQAVAFVVFGVCLLLASSIRPLEDALIPALAALAGLICCVAPDEVSDWTGSYGWTTRQYHNYPVEFLRWSGVASLVAVLVYLNS